MPTEHRARVVVDVALHHGEVHANDVGVVSRELAADSGAYRRITVSVRQTEAVARLRLPDDGHPAEARRPVVGTALFAIVDALLELPFVSDQGGRAMLIDLLHPDIAGTVAYHPMARLHVLSLVRTCMRYENGLADLLGAIRQMDGDTSTTVRQIEQIRYQLLPGGDC